MTKDQRKIRAAARRVRETLARIERDLWFARTAADYLNQTLGGHPSLDRITRAANDVKLALNHVDVTMKTIERW